MDLKDKKEILTQLYYDGKLSCGQLCDLIDNNVTYDMIVFKYKKDILSKADLFYYTYGACMYNNVTRARCKLPTSTNYHLDAILDNAEQIYDALINKNLLY